MESLLRKTAITHLTCAALVLLGACTAQSVAAADIALQVETEATGRVSVHADRAPLEAVVAEVARQTGLTVAWLGSRGGEPITARIEGADLAAALERILLGRNHTLFLEAGRPARVVIGSLTASARSRVPAPAPEAAETDAVELYDAYDPYDAELSAADLDDERRAGLDEDFSALRTVALEDEDAVNRASALDLLAERDEPLARDAIAGALGDADAGVREVALAALADRSNGADPLVLARVVERTAELGRSGLALLRERAVNDAAAEAALLQVANTDADPAVRAAAGELLDEIAAVRRAA